MSSARNADDYQVLSDSPATPAIPLLDTKEMAVHARHLVGEGHDTRLLATLFAAQPLPGKLAWKHLPAALFSGLTTAAGSVLYALGGSKLGDMYVAGGVSVNAPQTGLYGFTTWDYFSHFYTNFKHSWKSCTASMALGVSATLPSTFATWDLSSKGITGTLQTGASFVGGLPGNIYGMYLAIRKPLDYFKDNPRLREFLLQELRKDLPPERHSVLGHTPGLKSKIASYTLGGTFGTALAVSLTGYVCNTTVFMSNALNKIAAIVFGIFTNSPTAIVALTMSGFELSADVVELIVSLYKHITGDEKIILTDSDKKYFAGYLVAVAGFTYLGMYSGGTSQTLFDEDCPQVDNVGYDVLRNDVIYGTATFNTALMAIAFYRVCEYFKKAYEPKEENQNLFRLRNAVMFLREGPIEKLQEIAEQLYSDRRSEWEKVVKTAEPKVSLCSRVCFWRKGQEQIVTPENKLENTTGIAPV